MSKLKEMRIINEKSVKYIAELLNVSTVAIYYYETNRRSIPINSLKKLAKLYNCKIDDLID